MPQPLQQQRSQPVIAIPVLITLTDFIGALAAGKQPHSHSLPKSKTHSQYDIPNRVVTQIRCTQQHVLIANLFRLLIFVPVDDQTSEPCWFIWVLVEHMSALVLAMHALGICVMTSCKITLGCIAWMASPHTSFLLHMPWQQKALRQAVPLLSLSSRVLSEMGSNNACISQQICPVANCNLIASGAIFAQSFWSPNNILLERKPALDLATKDGCTAGMTIKFFALFFIQMCAMQPIYISLLAVFTPLGISIAALTGQALSKR